MSAPERPRVLCVDDEARVVEGLVLHLRKDYQVHTALSGDEALKVLKQIGGAAVVVSDMRMPGMNGAMLLHQVKSVYPDTTRILLTGEPGGMRRSMRSTRRTFSDSLTKPCPPDQLRAAVEAGVMQHRWSTRSARFSRRRCRVHQGARRRPGDSKSDRVRPREPREAAGHGVRGQPDCARYWQLEAAAMLSQIGYLSLPPPLVEKLYYGERPTPEEKTLASGVPEVAMKLLENIPRLEPVTQILAALNWPTRRSRGSAMARSDWARASSGSFWSMTCSSRRVTRRMWRSRRCAVAPRGSTQS